MSPRVLGVVQDHDLLGDVGPEHMVGPQEGKTPAFPCSSIRVGGGHDVRPLKIESILPNIDADDGDEG